MPVEHIVSPVILTHKGLQAQPYGTAALTLYFFYDLFTVRILNIYIFAPSTLRTMKIYGAEIVVR